MPSSLDDAVYKLECALNDAWNAIGQLLTYAPAESPLHGWARDAIDALESLDDEFEEALAKHRETA